MRITLSKHFFRRKRLRYYIECLKSPKTSALSKKQPNWKQFSIPCPQLCDLYPPHYWVPKVGCGVVRPKVPRFGAKGSCSRPASRRVKNINAEKFKSQHRSPYIHHHTSWRLHEVLTERNSSSTQQQPPSAQSFLLSVPNVQLPLVIRLWQPGGLNIRGKSAFKPSALHVYVDGLQAAVSVDLTHCQPVQCASRAADESLW